MNRREVLQRSAAVLGYAVTGPALAAIMQGCKASPELTYKPDFFTEDQALLVSELSEVIIPKTDTPGAKDAGVPGFIDALVKDVYSPEAREAFISKLTAFNEEAKTAYGSDFATCEPDEKVALVKKHHDEALAGKNLDNSDAWYRVNEKKSERPFILEFKELTMVGFFSSEPGATQVLQYTQVPGPFKGCVTVAEAGGKTYAT